MDLDGDDGAARGDVQCLSFVKITKGGLVKKVVREVYLRDDVPCGIKTCIICNEGSEGILTPNERLLVPDADVLLNFLDFIEKDESIDNCLILSSVLNKVRSKRFDIYGRLRALCKASLGDFDLEKAGHKKRFWVFNNEFSRHTFVQPKDGEAPDDFERRCITTAASWLSGHIRELCFDIQNDTLRKRSTLHKTPNELNNSHECSNSEPEEDDDDESGLIILSQDPQLQALSGTTGLRCLSVESYLQLVKDDFPLSGEQFALLVPPDSVKSASESGDRQAVFEQLLNETEIRAGLRKGVYLQGILRMSPDCNWRGIVFAAVRWKVVRKGNAMHECRRRIVDTERTPFDCVLEGKKYRVRGRRNLNRAIEGDTVAIEVTEAAASNVDKPVASKKKDNTSAVVPDVPVEIAEVDDEAEEFLDDDKDVNADEGLSMKCAETEHVKETGDDGPTAKVVGIIRQAKREFCGSLRPLTDDKCLSVATIERVFVPNDKRIPNIIIKTRQSQALDGKRLVVVIDSWDRFQRLPRGHWTEILGSFGDPKAEGALILRENGLTTSPFSAAALRCLPPADWDVSFLPLSEREKRLDLRDKLVCSIDPPGCTDIDDALSYERLDNGLVRVGVHIADVTYFMRPDTQLDKEASERCTSVYLVDQRISMLPALLTSNLCSLVGGQERLAFSVLWDMDDEGNIKHTTFSKTIIKSAAAFTYQEAQSKIDDSNDQSPLAKNLRGLLSISRFLRKKRMLAGGLQLASPDVQIIRQVLEQPVADASIGSTNGNSSAGIDTIPTSKSESPEDAVNQESVDVTLYQARDTNKMVEDFMLLANVSVAKEIEKHFPGQSLLRRHPPPKEASLQSLKKLLDAKGFPDFDFSTSKALGKSLDAVAKKMPEMDFLVRVMTCRCMHQAIYFGSGAVEEEVANDSVRSGKSGETETSKKVSSYPLYHHYGLGASIYTHFTSPIRRYADVVVHRLLAASIGIERPPALAGDKDKMSRQCDLLNTMHRAAQIASRQSVEFYVYLFFAKKKRQEVEAVITKIKKNGALVYIHEYGLEGVVFFDEEFEADLESQTIVIKKGHESAQTLSVFSKIKILAYAEAASDFRPSVKMKYLGPVTEKTRA